MRYLALASAMALSGCGVDCLASARDVSGLAIPDSAQMTECLNDDSRSELTVVFRLSPEQYASVRAEALRAGYQSIADTPSLPRGWRSLPFQVSAGLFHFQDNPNNSFHLAALEDSSRKVMTVLHSDF